MPFAVDDGAVDGGEVDDGAGIFLRLGEWDAAGALRSARSVELERATWQHDIAVTAEHVVFMESPTTRLAHDHGGSPAVPYGWVPGAEAWVGVLPRGGGGGDDGPGDGSATSAVRWIRLDPSLVTHVLGAYDAPDGTIVMYVCCYGVPELGQPVDLSMSVVGAAGVGLSGIGGTLGVLERWRIVADGIERVQVDERSVEYPRMDPRLEGAAFRYGYALETAWAAVPPASGPSAGVAEAAPVGLLKFDLARDEIASWSPGAGRTPNEPLFVRAIDGHGDDEGWLLTVVDDLNRGASDIYVLDATALGRADPRQSFTCRRECRCGATESGCRRTGIADRSDRTGSGLWSPAFLCVLGDRSHLHGTHPREGRTATGLGVAANRSPRFERHPSSPGDLRTPESASGSCRRTGPPAGVARRRRHLHGGLARPAVRRLRRHRTRNG